MYYIALRCRNCNDNHWTSTNRFRYVGKHNPQQRKRNQNHCIQQFHRPTKSFSKHATDQQWTIWQDFCEETIRVCLTKDHKRLQILQYNQQAEKTIKENQRRYTCRIGKNAIRQSSILGTILQDDTYLTRFSSVQTKQTRYNDLAKPKHSRASLDNTHGPDLVANMIGTIVTRSTCHVFVALCGAICGTMHMCGRKNTTLELW